MPLNLTISQLDGGQVSKEFPEGEIILGSDCTDRAFTLAGTGIAPRHAKLSLQPDRLCIEDLNTETGTLVFGCAITDRVEVDYPSDLQIGDLKLCVAFSGPSENSTAPLNTTLRIEHSALPNRRHLTPPAGPDVTGRIYRAHTESDADAPARDSSSNTQEIRQATPTPTPTPPAPMAWHWWSADNPNVIFSHQSPAPTSSVRATQKDEASPVQQAGNSAGIFSGALDGTMTRQVDS